MGLLYPVSQKCLVFQPEASSWMKRKIFDQAAGNHSLSQVSWPHSDQWCSSHAVRTHGLRSQTPLGDAIKGKRFPFVHHGVRCPCHYLQSEQNWVTFGWVWAVFTWCLAAPWSEHVPCSHLSASAKACPSGSQPARVGSFSHKEHKHTIRTFHIYYHTSYFAL